MMNNSEFCGSFEAKPFGAADNARYWLGWLFEQSELLHKLASASIRAFIADVSRGELLYMLSQRRSPSSQVERDPL